MAASMAVLISRWRWSLIIWHHHHHHPHDGDDVLFFIQSIIQSFMRRVERTETIKNMFGSFCLLDQQIWWWSCFYYSCMLLNCESFGANETAKEKERERKTAIETKAWRSFSCDMRRMQETRIPWSSQCPWFSSVFGIKLSILCLNLLIISVSIVKFYKIRGNLSVNRSTTVWHQILWSWWLVS